jgi:hypothetical protein
MEAAAEGAAGADEDWSLAQLRSSSAPYRVPEERFPAPPDWARKAQEPSLWSVLKFVSFGEASGLSTSGHKLAAHLFCCVVAFVGLVFMCMQHCVPGLADTVDSRVKAPLLDSEPDWYTRSPKKKQFNIPDLDSHAAPLGEPCVTVSIATPRPSDVQPRLPVSRSESFASCAELNRSCDGELSPRSFLSVADNDDEPLSRPQSPEEKEEEEQRELQRDVSRHGVEVQRDWVAGSYSNFADRALAGPILR